MKKCFRRTLLLLIISITTVLMQGQTNKTCCEDAGCRTSAKEYAIRVTGLVAYLPPCTSDNDQNKRAVDSLKNANQSVYNELMKAAKEAHRLFFSDESKFRKDACFSDALPTDFKSNVIRWVAYVGGLGKPPKFPSAEFCSGLKVRIETGQGATDIGKNTTGYLGSLRGYLSYTPGKKDDCGNSIRIMAGPALFARGSTLYGALSSRIAFRVFDFTPNQFPIGNLNLFGEYNTSFGNLSYGAIGGEVELGFVGFNISVNNNMKTGKKGFGVNVFYVF